MNQRRWSRTLMYLVVAAQFGALATRATAQSLPERLTDREFWKLSAEFSEPDGTFRSDNLLSNESDLQYLISDLLQTAKPGGVYLGVGPEQNFTYIAALKPEMAFIIDIRRGNLNLQLMYKALFELAKDRAEFVGWLFSRTPPPGLGPQSTAADIFAAYAKVQPSEALYRQNLKAIQDRLVVRHGFPLSADDLSGIEYVYRAFYTYGPDLSYSSSSGSRPVYYDTPFKYAELMTATDETGKERSYLGTEASFAFLKDFQEKNLIVPLVGDFSGARAIRAVATYLKELNAVVSVFYLSNVEQYLEAGLSWGRFCANAMTLPVDETSTFIRAVSDPNLSAGLKLELGNVLFDLTLGTVSCR